MDLPLLSKLVENSIAAVAVFVLLWFFLREMMKLLEIVAKQQKEDHATFAKQISRLLQELGVRE